MFEGEVLVKGRQILWLINEQFRTSSTTDSFYDILDLANLQYPGDQKMSSFFALWDVCITSIHPRLPDDQLRDTLVKKLKNFNLNLVTFKSTQIKPFT